VTMAWNAVNGTSATAAVLTSGSGAIPTRFLNSSKAQQ
jgi:hypothetical protein